MRASFFELVPEEYSGALVIVDVDGTLVSDRGTEFSGEAKHLLRQLSSVAKVFLCSNALPMRTARFAQEAGVGHLNSKHKKPSRRVIESVETLPSRVVVIGDKVVTDGLFAKNISAEFVHVRRVIGPSASVRGRIGYLVDELVRPAFFALAPLMPFIILMRPTQWVKNILVFTPLFFAGAAFSLPLVGQSVIAFLSFSFAASALYVLNDYRDREMDALHPTKRFRPLASGVVGGRGAALLISANLMGSFLLGLFIPPLFVPLALYVALNTAYSLFLKHVPVADVASVSGSYILRVLAGGAATGIFVSPWLIACVFFGALILISGKRRAEFVRHNRRSVLKRYSKKLLDGMLIGAAAFAIISYALYAMVAGHGPLVTVSALVVTAAILRLTHQVLKSEDAEYPEVLALKDPYILGLSLVWLALMFFALYP